MFHLYLYEGANLQGEVGEALVKEVAAVYLESHAVSADGETPVCFDLNIQRTEKGKPYFTSLPLHFNVSHSAMMWVCLLGESPCGIDIQEVRDCSYKKLAARYFDRHEQSYVLKNGLKGFFTVWTRREAFGKYTGEGFFGANMPAFVDETGQLKSVLRGAGRGGVDVYVRQLDLGDFVKCAYCNEEEEDEIQIIG